MSLILIIGLTSLVACILIFLVVFFSNLNPDIYKSISGFSPAKNTSSSTSSIPQIWANFTKKINNFFSIIGNQITRQHLSKSQWSSSFASTYESVCEYTGAFFAQDAMLRKFISFMFTLICAICCVFAPVGFMLLTWASMMIGAVLTFVIIEYGPQSSRNMGSGLKINNDYNMKPLYLGAFIFSTGPIIAAITFLIIMQVYAPIIPLASILFAIALLLFVYVSSTKPQEAAASSPSPSPSDSATSITASSLRPTALKPEASSDSEEEKETLEPPSSRSSDLPPTPASNLGVTVLEEAADSRNSEDETKTAASPRSGGSQEDRRKALASAAEARIRASQNSSNRLATTASFSSATTEARGDATSPSSSSTQSQQTAIEQSNDGTFDLDEARLEKLEMQNVR